MYIPFFTTPEHYRSKVDVLYLGAPETKLGV